MPEDKKSDDKLSANKMAKPPAKWPGKPGKPMKDQAGKNRRSLARLGAVQALYQMDVAGTNLKAIIAEFGAFRLGNDLEGEQLEKADFTFFEDLLTGIVREQKQLDPLIDNHLAKSWRLNRIDSTLRAILRAGAYELTNRPEIPPAVVISEYVDVAHAFFEKDEPKVVNAVLQSLLNNRNKKPQDEGSGEERV